MGSRGKTLHGVWQCSYHPHSSRVTSRVELMGPPPAPAPGPTPPQRSIEKRCRGEPLLLVDRGAPSSWAAECPVLKYVPSPDVAWICFSSARCKSSFPGERQQGKQPCLGAGKAGRAGRQAAEPVQRQPAPPFIASAGRWTRIFIFSELVF